MGVISLQVHEAVILPCLALSSPYGRLVIKQWDVQENLIPTKTFYKENNIFEQLVVLLFVFPCFFFPPLIGFIFEFGKNGFSLLYL